MTDVDSLWSRLQALPKQAREEIMKNVGGKYETGFFLQTQLTPWFESQPWNDAGANHRKLIQDLVEAISVKVSQLREQPSSPFLHFIIPKLEQVSNDIMQRDDSNWRDCVQQIGQFLQYEQQMINEAVQPTPEVVSEVTVEMTDVEVKPTLAELLQQLALSRNENEEKVRQLEHDKEQYVISFECIMDKKAKMEHKLNMRKMEVGEKNLHAVQEDVQRFEQELAKIQESIKKKAEELLRQRVEVIKCFYNQYLKIEEAQKLFLTELNSWLEAQKLSLSGWPAPPDISFLQEWASTLAQVTWHSYNNVSKVGNLFERVLPDHNKEVDKLKEFLKKLFVQLLNKTFIVEKQPPQVLKTQTKFAATVRLLSGGAFNLETTPPEVVATIISEKQARDLLKGVGRTEAPSDDILNNKKTMELNSSSKIPFAEFKNMSLKRANRQGKKATETVTAEKSTIMFSTNIHFGAEPISIRVMSLPIAVIVHGNQQADAEATILWDNAFSQMVRVPFQVPEQVAWPKVAEALSYRWKLCNGTPLSTEQLRYIALKALGPDHGDLSQAVLTRQQFNKELTLGRGKTFTFWQWFYAVLDLVKRHFVSEWKDELITGFISRNDAEARLVLKEPGTFLLRFSDSEIGGVTAAYLDEERQAQSIEPWTNKHLGMRKLADMVHDLDQLLYLYPNFHKDETFGKYYTGQDGNNDDGYQRTQFTLVLNNGSNRRRLHSLNSTPTHSMTDGTPPHPGIEMDLPGLQMAVESLLVESGCDFDFPASNGAATGYDAQPVTTTLVDYLQDAQYLQDILLSRDGIFPATE